MPTTTAKATAAEKAQAKLLREQAKAIKKEQAKFMREQAKAAKAAQKAQEKAHAKLLREQAKAAAKAATAKTKTDRDIPVLVPIQPRYVDSSDELNVLRSRVAALEAAIATLMMRQQ